MKKANFSSYGDYSSDNYGEHSLCFTDPQDRDFYYSYKTLVAFRTCKTGLVVIKNYWSTTTGKHLNWIDGGDKKGRVNQEEFDKLYTEAFGI